MFTSLLSTCTSFCELDTVSHYYYCNVWYVWKLVCSSFRVWIIVLLSVDWVCCYISNNCLLALIINKKWYLPNKDHSSEKRVLWTDKGSMKDTILRRVLRDTVIYCDAKNNTLTVVIYEQGIRNGLDLSVVWMTEQECSRQTLYFKGLLVAALYLKAMELYFLTSRTCLDVFLFIANLLYRIP